MGALMRWYVLQTYSQFEHQVKRALLERIEREGLQEYFGQILVPSEEVVEIKDGKKRSSQRKFFPGYVLVEMEMNELTWHLVNSTPKVSGFVGGTVERPVPPAAHPRPSPCASPIARCCPAWDAHPAASGRPAN